MSEIYRYVLVDEFDNEEDYEYIEYENAVVAAQVRKLNGERIAIIQRTYLYDDSALVWTPDGSDTWPPKN